MPRHIGSWGDETEPNLTSTILVARREARRLDADALWRRFGHGFDQEVTAFWNDMGHAGSQWRSSETIAWVVEEVRAELAASRARQEAEREARARAARAVAEGIRARQQAAEDRRWNRPDLKADPGFRAAILDHFVDAAFHWTPMGSLESVFINGIRPRALLDQRRIPYEAHSYGTFRKDREFSNHAAVSMYPQRGMMWKAEDPVLLRLDATVLAREGAFYVPGNTAASRFEFAEVSRFTTAQHFENLFIEPGSPTLVDWQAEIWIHGGVPPSDINTVFVRDESALRVAETALLRGWDSGLAAPSLVIDQDLSGRIELAISLDDLIAELPAEDHAAGLPF